MPGHTARRRLLPACASLLLLVFSIPLLGACLPAGHDTPRQMVVEWPEKQRLFIADERTGNVRAFHLGSGAPVPAAQTRTFDRSSVRDMQLDPARQQLWVLGSDGVYVHNADSLALQRRIPLDGRVVAMLRIDHGNVTLLDAGHRVLGHINRATLLAAWLPASSVRQG